MVRAESFWTSSSLAGHRMQISYDADLTFEGRRYEGGSDVKDGRLMRHCGRGGSQAKLLAWSVLPWPR